ncbi:hypothetical protein UFOVP724_71 [uncultured Caudovirales phage]|uniref:Uncharacterized protein n=1 Tax=uncultured Caudovirales phage TaxID=2100421 RepID=A0A6J5NMM4_9CAUD|nr:hypothetical protein UFOVP724_71 [uncultured Caudovirales phage]
MTKFLYPNRNIKIYKSTKENQLIKNHEQIVEKINEKLKWIFKENYQDIDFAVAGSFAINSIFYPGKEYADIDIYPKSKLDYMKFKEILRETNSFETENALSCMHMDDSGRIKFQIVKTEFSNLQDLFSNFDFTISCCAYYKSDLYMTNECLRNISRNELSMNQKNFDKSNLDVDTQMYQVHTLFSRITKYTDRYELGVGKNVYKLLREIKNNVDQKHFKIQRNEASITNSSGEVEFADIDLDMWSVVKHILLDEMNPYKREFEEYLT